MSTSAGVRLPPAPPPTGRVRGPVATALARDAFGREIAEPEQTPPETADSSDTGPKPKKEMATDALGRRAGALSDELNFPEFVSSLVHGTFDAMVNSSIRQMQAFADLVGAVAKPLDQFAQENVSTNQVRDYLVEQHPRDIRLESKDGEFSLAPAAKTASGEDGEDSDASSPGWLKDYGHEGAELTPDFLEQELLPAARTRVARARLQTLSTMVLLGMNRIIIKDGTIGARLRFRAAASDHAAVQYATSNDPQTGEEAWGRRAGSSEPLASTKVSTVGVNVQSDSELKAELFGEVKINFASETVPLDRFIDDAKRTLLERHSRSVPQTGRAAEPLRLVPSGTPTAEIPAAPAAAPAPAPSAPQPAPTTPPGTPR